MALAIALSANPAAARNDRNEKQALDGGTSRVTQINIERVESPTFEGRSFGDVGQYKKIVGRLRGEIDPSDERNRVITDLDKAPRNARGRVEYSTDFYLLAPVDPEAGNHAIFAEVVNRGNKIMIFALNRAPLLADPTKAADAGDGFLFEQGYTLLWVGWQGDLNPAPGRMRLEAPLATEKGQAIKGVVRSEFLTTTIERTLPLSSGSFTGTTHQSYPAVSLDNSGTTLTRRLKEDDAREQIPNNQWQFASCPAGAPPTPSLTDICYASGFQPGWLYELIYTAKNPRVLGVGLAALRDAAIFFRSALADDAGTPNPLVGDEEGLNVRHAVLFGISQSGRLIRSFQQLGFNSDARGQKVYEAVWPHIGPGRIPLDVRFGQPGRAYGEHEDHLYPAYEFPFTYATSTDPLSGRTGSLLSLCREARNCPKVFHTMSSLEYWQGKQSLNQTDPLGTRDLPDLDNVRMYLIASTQHVPAPPSPGICQQLANPAPQAETMRALLVDLRNWLEKGTQPPSSEVPTIADGTLVSSDQASTGFPKIPGVTYSGLVNSAPVLDFGPGFNGDEERGVISIEPPRVLGRYQVLVPRTDADGNDAAGIRSTTLRAPVATYTGWNLRRQGFAEGELCGLTGSYIPFARTPAERVARGDPRPTLVDRYGDHEGYVEAVRDAAGELVDQRFLLPEDAKRLIAEAVASNVLR
jgi:hypothetical protein